MDTIIKQARLLHLESQLLLAELDLLAICCTGLAAKMRRRRERVGRMRRDVRGEEG